MPKPTDRYERMSALSALSQLLRRRRQELDVSLITLGSPETNRRIKKRIPPQTLNNYESGAYLPRRPALPELAKCYDLPLEDLEAAYTSSSVLQSAQGAYSEKFYQGVLQSLVPGDHLVTVTQQSLAEDRKVAGFIADLVAKGARKTFVAYQPNGPTPFRGDNIRWASNHQQAALTLAEEFNAQGIPADGEGLCYLLIGNPTMDDLFFLQGYGGSPFLVRSEDSDSRHEPYQAWYQMESTEDRRWWVPHSGDHIGAMRHWLTYSCGLDLPRTKAPPTAPNEEERELRHLTLADYLAT